MEDPFREDNLPDIPEVSIEISDQIKELSKAAHKFIRKRKLPLGQESRLDAELQHSIEELTATLTKAMVSKKIIISLKKYNLKAQDIETILSWLDEASLTSYIFILHFLTTYEDNAQDLIDFVDKYMDEAFEIEVHTLLSPAESIAVTSPFLNFLLSQLPKDDFHFDDPEVALYELGAIIEEISDMLLAVREFLVSPSES